MASKIRQAWNRLRNRNKLKKQEEARAIARNYKAPAPKPGIEVGVNRLYEGRKSLGLEAIMQVKGNDFGARKTRKNRYFALAQNADRTIRIKNLSRPAPEIQGGRAKPGESTRLMVVRDFRGSIGLMVKFGDTAVAREIMPLVDGMLSAMHSEKTRTREVPQDNAEITRELRAAKTDLLKIVSAHDREMARRRGLKRDAK